MEFHCRVATAGGQITEATYVAENETPSPKDSKARAVAKASNAKQGERKKAAPKRIASKTLPESMRKPKRIRKKPGGDDRQS